MAIIREYRKVRLKSTKKRISFAMLILLPCCILLRLSPLVKMYWINYLTALVVSNWIYIIIIALLFLALHIIEEKQFYEQLEKEKKRNGIR